VRNLTETTRLRLEWGGNGRVELQHRNKNKSLIVRGGGQGGGQKHTLRRKSGGRSVRRRRVGPGVAENRRGAPHGRSFLWSTNYLGEPIPQSESFGTSTKQKRAEVMAAEARGSRVQ